MSEQEQMKLDMVKNLALLLMDDNPQMTIEQALATVINSDTYLRLQRDATGLYHTNPFDARSAFGSAVVFNWKLTQQGESFTDMQKTMQEFREVRPYYYEDFYPLSGIGNLTGDDIWLAYQLHRPSDQTGYVLAFRRSQSPQSDYQVNLSALDPETRYQLVPKDGGESQTLSGRELMDGLTLHLDQPRSSLLLFYKPL